MRHTEEERALARRKKNAKYNKAHGRLRGMWKWTKKKKKAE